MDRAATSDSAPRDEYLTRPGGNGPASRNLSYRSQRADTKDDADAASMTSSDDHELDAIYSDGGVEDDEEAGLTTKERERRRRRRQRGGEMGERFAGGKMPLSTHSDSKTLADRQMMRGMAINAALIGSWYVVEVEQRHSS